MAILKHIRGGDYYIPFYLKDAAGKTLNPSFFEEIKVLLYNMKSGNLIRKWITCEIFDDWFLPSYDELGKMHKELYKEGVGGFTNDKYWCSSEQTSIASWILDFNTEIYTTDYKDELHYVRSCRTFIAAEGAYSLRDIGPAGGLIFYIDGTTYYEAAPSDQSTGKAWSNITDQLIGTTLTSIGEGENNTDEIIAQAGHTDSAAKLCDDLSVEGSPLTGYNKLTINEDNIEIDIPSEITEDAESGDNRVEIWTTTEEGLINCETGILNEFI